MVVYAYKNDLSKMCEDLGLDMQGTRDDLIERIWDWFQEEFGHRVPESEDEDEDEDEEEDDEEEEEEEDELAEQIELKLQGRPDHRKMQGALAELGQLLGHHVRTNHSIGAGFMPDVLWFRLDPAEHPNAAPVAAFEIEFGSAQAIAKSLSSLKHSFDLGSKTLFLILPGTRVDGAKLRLGGAFHEIKDDITVLPIEETINLDAMKLAKLLGVLKKRLSALLGLWHPCRYALRQPGFGRYLLLSAAQRGLVRAGRPPWPTSAKAVRCRPCSPS